MAGILSGKTAPCPEVASGKESAALTVLADEVEYITVIFIAGSGRCLFGEAETVTGKTEFLQNDRLAVLPGNDHVVIYILLSIFLGTRKKFLQAVRLHPTPVVRPDVDIQIIDVGVGMNLLEKIHIHFASPRALTAGRHHVVRVK